MSLSMYQLNKERYDRLEIKDWSEIRQRKLLSIRNKRRKRKRKR